MAFFGSDWFEQDKRVGPMAHWLEDDDIDDNDSGIMSSHFNGKKLPIEQPESNYESLLRRLDESIENNE